MESHLSAGAVVTPPDGMYLGTLLPVEGHPSVSIMSVYGTGRLAPGCYLVDARYSRHGQPLAGPFDDVRYAMAAWNASFTYQQQQLPHRRLAFMAADALMFDMVTLLNAGVIQMGRKSRVDDMVKLEGGQGLVIGDHVHIASFCHIGIGGGITILEEGSSFASGAKVHSGSNMPDAPSCSATAPADQQRSERLVTRICKNATIYAGAQIKAGVTVGESARVAMGAVVLEDVEPFTLVAGVPAVVKGSYKKAAQ